MKVMPERMHRVEVLIRSYVIRCWVESNPQRTKEALYILQEASNGTYSSGLLALSYFVMPGLYSNHTNQCLRKGEKTP
jgi:hypothetical protein